MVRLFAAVCSGPASRRWIQPRPTSPPCLSNRRRPDRTIQKPTAIFPLPILVILLIESSGTPDQSSILLFSITNFYYNCHKFFHSFLFKCGFLNLNSWIRWCHLIKNNDCSNSVYFDTKLTLYLETYFAWLSFHRVEDVVSIMSCIWNNLSILLKPVMNKKWFQEVIRSNLLVERIVRRCVWRHPHRQDPWGTPVWSLGRWAGFPSGWTWCWPRGWRVVPVCVVRLGLLPPLIPLKCRFLLFLPLQMMALNPKTVLLVRDALLVWRCSKHSNYSTLFYFFFSFH